MKERVEQGLVSIDPESPSEFDDVCLLYITPELNVF